MKNLAIFASGSGSNAENIINHFAASDEIKIALILTNNPDAFVLERAKKHNIPTFTFSRNDFNNTSIVVDELKKYNIDYIVLAGFLLLVPKSITDLYCGRIINIHPALLPKFGGKGMYGDNVHVAVKENGETKTGITIHHVNERFDDGDIIFQAECDIDMADTPQTIAEKVHSLEYKHFPEVIAKHITNSNK